MHMQNPECLLDKSISLILVVFLLFSCWCFFFKSQGTKTRYQPCCFKGVNSLDVRHGQLVSVWFYRLSFTPGVNI